MNTNQLCMNLENIDANLANLESPVILALVSICYQLDCKRMKACSDLLFFIADLPVYFQEKTITALLTRVEPLLPALNVVSICKSANDDHIKACGEILLIMSELSSSTQKLVIKTMLERVKPS